MPDHSVPAPQICHTLRDIKQDSVIEYSLNFRMVCILLHFKTFFGSIMAVEKGV